MAAGADTGIMTHVADEGRGAGNRDVPSSFTIAIGDREHAYGRRYIATVDRGWDREHVTYKLSPHGIVVQEYPLGFDVHYRNKYHGRLFLYEDRTVGYSPADSSMMFMDLFSNPYWINYCDLVCGKLVVSTARWPDVTIAGPMAYSDFNRLNPSPVKSPLQDDYLKFLATLQVYDNTTFCFLLSKDYSETWRKGVMLDIGYREGYPKSIPGIQSNGNAWRFVRNVIDPDGVVQDTPFESSAPLIIIRRFLGSVYGDVKLAGSSFVGDQQIDPTLRGNSLMMAEIRHLDDYFCEQVFMGEDPCPSGYCIGTEELWDIVIPKPKAPTLGGVNQDENGAPIGMIMQT